MNQLRSKFAIGAVKESDFPVSNLPEVAFAGRSNVGKSSLLNFVLLDSSVARVSSLPGKTQQINFFLVESKWMFADLPGYGYSKASRDKRQTWSKLNTEYLRNRLQLRLICILLDSRLDPQPMDLSLVEELENSGRYYALVLTKCDKNTAEELREREAQIATLVSFCKFCVGTVSVSSRKKTGRDELLAIIKRATKTDNT